MGFVPRFLWLKEYTPTDILAASGHRGGAEKSNPATWRQNYVALYWTFNDNCRDLKNSRTINYQRKLVYDYVNKHGGEIVAELAFEERQSRGTKNIRDAVFEIASIAKLCNATLFHVASDSGDRWRAHQWLEYALGEAKVNVHPLPYHREMLDYFRRRRRDDQEKLTYRRLRRKISEGVKRAHKEGATPGLMSAEAPRIRRMGSTANQKSAAEFDVTFLNFLIEKKIIGSNQFIADYLNGLEKETRNGKKWNKETVRKALAKKSQYCIRDGIYVIE